MHGTIVAVEKKKRGRLGRVGSGRVGRVGSGRVGSGRVNVVLYPTGP